MLKEQIPFRIQPELAVCCVQSWRAMDNVQWITFFTPSLARRLPCEAQALLGWRKEAR